ncbi:sulfite exporter TauE/SafE family protein [Denitrificimonas sp. JX-1]|uniref:Sulfite exporter TauE/SafE family protein n=1 Tax=Denitrificimonas halotolerans TaxID=3098930 RepID=A0ABU5GTB4_9GAMM|nr:sulfite exporter TauE/SafE family protein [Denitrificimonas sp. JX-1]MDY7220109.1 sulfite exporter TauE/SafE family protein [Denitrificimonas sp. JX-1]
MTDMIPLLASAFTLGLLGAGHCLGMCGGLMGALTLSIPEAQRHKRSRIIIGYNLGRVCSYAIAGFLFGLLGWAVEQTPAAMAMRVIAGLLLISLGLYLAGWWHGLTRIENIGRHLWTYIQPIASRLLPVKSMPHAVLLGALWGWLPCGLVYSTLFWTASQGNASTSALLMFTFGLGTWPVLLASGFAAEKMTAFLRKKNVRYTAGTLVILYGLWTLPGPHQHWLMGH